jgi:hypothetical protein
MNSCTTSFEVCGAGGKDSQPVMWTGSIALIETFAVCAGAASIP